MPAALTRPLARWAVPVVIAALVVGAGAATKWISASAETSLPPRSASQLLSDVASARLQALSGTVVQRSDLGLPDLPTGGQGSSDLTSLISGAHTLRIWYAGPDKVRLALLGTLGESDVIRNGRDLWTWASRDNTATHRQLSDQVPSTVDQLPQAPPQAAEQLLSAIEPSTEVTTDGTATVAGRPAYELVLTPRDSATLVGQVRIAVDATEHIPLRLQVIPRGHTDPAFEVAFTRVSFARPDDAEFRFTPPPGVTVKEGGNDVAAPGKALANPQSTLNRLHEAIGKATGGAAPSGEQGPQVVGSGWTAVLVARNDTPLGHARPGQQEQPAQPGQPGESGAGPDQGGNPLDRVLGALPRVSGSWGSGRLLRSSLFTVLITDDGRVLVGAVTADRLYQVAATAQAR
jgi:outer membrane lipoprotein-sorting protein